MVIYPLNVEWMKNGGFQFEKVLKYFKRMFHYYTTFPS